MYIMKTKYGNVGIESSPIGISEIRLNVKSNRGQLSKKADRNLQSLVSLLEDYFKGKRVSFNVKLNLVGLPDFTRKVLNDARKIPFGKTITYGEIAKRIGHPKASRAVGQALGANPLPIIIPCHRVIRKDKSLGGFAGGLKWKKILLELENRATDDHG